MIVANYPQGTTMDQATKFYATRRLPDEKSVQNMFKVVQKTMPNRYFDLAAEGYACVIRMSQAQEARERRTAASISAHSKSDSPTKASLLYHHQLTPEDYDHWEDTVGGAVLVASDWGVNNGGGENEKAVGVSPSKIGMSFRYIPSLGEVRPSFNQTPKGWSKSVIGSGLSALTNREYTPATLAPKAKVAFAPDIVYYKAKEYFSQSSKKEEEGGESDAKSKKAKKGKSSSKKKKSSSSSKKTKNPPPAKEENPDQGSPEGDSIMDVLDMAIGAQTGAPPAQRPAKVTEVIELDVADLPGKEEKKGKRQKRSVSPSRSVDPISKALSEMRAELSEVRVKQLELGSQFRDMSAGMSANSLKGIKDGLSPIAIALDNLVGDKLPSLGVKVVESVAAVAKVNGSMEAVEKKIVLLNVAIREHIREALGEAVAKIIEAVHKNDVPKRKVPHGEGGIEKHKKHHHKVKRHRSEK